MTAHRLQLVKVVAVQFRINRRDADVVIHDYYHGQCHGQGRSGDIERAERPVLPQQLPSLFEITSDHYHICFSVSYSVVLAVFCPGYPRAVRPVVRAAGSFFSGSFDFQHGIFPVGAHVADDGLLTRAQPFDYFHMVEVAFAETDFPFHQAVFLLFDEELIFPWPRIE